MPHINPKQSRAHPGFIFYANAGIAGPPRPSQVHYHYSTSAGLVWAREVVIMLDGAAECEL